MKQNFMWVVVLIVAATLLISQTGSLAYDINHKFSIGGIIDATDYIDEMTMISRESSAASG